MNMNSAYMKVFFEILTEVFAAFEVVNIPKDGVGALIKHCGTYYGLTESDGFLIASKINTTECFEVSIEGIDPLSAAHRLCRILVNAYVDTNSNRGKTEYTILNNCSAKEIEDFADKHKLKNPLHPSMLFFSGMSGDEINESDEEMYLNTIPKEERKTGYRIGILCIKDEISAATVLAIPEIGWFDTDEEARRQAREDGYFFIDNLHGIEKGIYLDAPEIRKMCKRQVELNPQYAIEAKIMRMIDGQRYAYYDYVTALRPGYIITASSDNTAYIPDAEHIEQDKEIFLYESDPAAVAAAIKDGVALIYDMAGVPDGIYLDTQANRQIIQSALARYPEFAMSAAILSDSDCAGIIEEIQLFCVEFDNGDSNCYLGTRIPTVEEAYTFCAEHIRGNSDWSHVVDVYGVKREQAEGLWDLSVFNDKEKVWPVFRKE